MPDSEFHYPAVEIWHGEDGSAERVEVDGVPWPVISVDARLSREPSIVVLRVRPSSVIVHGPGERVP